MKFANFPPCQGSGDRFDLTDDQRLRRIVKCHECDRTLGTRPKSVSPGRYQGTVPTHTAKTKSGAGDIRAAMPSVTIEEARDSAGTALYRLEAVPA